MEFNLADLFESVADAVPEREALVCGDQRLTYRALDERANRVANLLRAAGIGPGEHVGIQLHNGTEYVVTLLGCLKVRVVPVNVNYRYVAAELAYLYDNADLVALVFDAGLAGPVREAAARAPTLRGLYAVGGDPAFEDAVDAQPSTRDFPARSADDVYIIYTGGTTGMPKGVQWRHEDLFFAGMLGGNPYGAPAVEPGDVAARVGADPPGMTSFPVAPLIHGAAQLTVFITFFQGAKAVLVPRFDPAEVLRTIAREKVNTINIVGDAMAGPIAEALAGPMAGTDMSSLMVISSAGALLSERTRDALRAVLPNVMVVNSFGSSETGFNGSSMGEGGLVRIFATDRTAVLDEDRRPVAPGSGVVGWVAQRGRVPLGYYKDPEKSAATFVDLDGDRWTILPDRAVVEADGSVTVLGRESACINTGGEKVFAEEVEAAVKDHPAVLDAIVAGVPDERYGERVAAVVQARPGSTLDPAQLQAHCRERLAGYKIPRLVVTVDHVRRSPSGKPDYPWAKQVLSASSPAPPGAPGS